jgi:pimeloyl-ACP methyl ester carboxylesterase
MLPKDRSYLALDLPGHGLSSRIPDGIQYHGVDNLYMLNHLCEEYKWDKLSLMGHSMGSILSFMFACVFPEKVDMLIQIDALKPQVPNPERVAKNIKNSVEKFMLADRRNKEKTEPPAYTYEEMIDKVFEGTYGSVTKETAEYLLKRNIKKSEKFPGKFYFVRDSRLKHSFTPNFSQPVILELSKGLQMPHVFFKATNAPYWEEKKYFDEVIEILKKNPKFEFHTIESTHHLQLTEPEKISPIISDFIIKNQLPTSSKL